MQCPSIRGPWRSRTTTGTSKHWIRACVSRAPPGATAVSCGRTGQPALPSRTSSRAVGDFRDDGNETPIESARINETGGHPLAANKHRCVACAEDLGDLLLADKSEQAQHARSFPKLRVPWERMSWFCLLNWRSLGFARENSDEKAGRRRLISLCGRSSLKHRNTKLSCGRANPPPPSLGGGPRDNADVRAVRQYYYYCLRCA